MNAKYFHFRKAHFDCTNVGIGFFFVVINNVLGFEEYGQFDLSVLLTKTQTNK